MKSIIVTGASSGIGRATALHLAANGWQVGAVARRVEKLEELAGAQANITPLAADVTQEAEVDALFEKFAEKTGRIDALFNNAGHFGKAGTIDQIDLATWQSVIDLNLTGMFLCARAAFRHMRAQAPQGGRIINNGSISAHVPRDGSICYTTTKHGVTGLTRTLSLDGRPFDIACGQIDIGNARTEMVEAQNARQVAAGREPDPSMDVQNVADAVLYMANLPLEANVQFMTVMATKMPYIGRG